MRWVALVLAALAIAPGSARAQDSCVVRGRILGHDGKPLPKVGVRPIEPWARYTIADREGRFTLTLPCGGARVLDLAGVHHENLRLPAILVSGAPLEVDVRLRAQEWTSRYDSVRVVVESSGYSPAAAIPMARRGDGTFVATVPCESESLRYQLLGVAKDGIATAGTMADTFFVSGSQSIASIRAGRKPVEVVFEPKRLPHSRRDAMVRFADLKAVSAIIYPLFREAAEEGDRKFAAYRAYLAGGGDRDSFRWDPAPLVADLKRRVAAERDPIRRQYLLLWFLLEGGAHSDTTFALKALGEVPPESPLWALNPSGPSNTLWGVRLATGRPEVIRAYAEAGSERHADEGIRAGFLMAAMSEAEVSGDKGRLGRYATRMLDEFANTHYADMTRKLYAPGRAIQPGRPTPEFAFSALEDSTQTFRVADFRGRHLLIDFWAVWCLPCRIEMPHLQSAWEAYKDRGLSILSVSFDNTRADVAPYRRDKWPMPWLHAFAPQGFFGQESATFEVAGIPKPILIGPDGAIVAAGEDLRGDKLDAVLAREIGEAKPGGAGKD